MPYQQSLKQAVIEPIHKKGEDDPGNYRPISLKPSLFVSNMTESDSKAKKS